MEKPKKERKFLKAIGKIGMIILEKVLLKVGDSIVAKIGGRKKLPSIIFITLFCNIAFASIDSIPYPITGNKQRLGWQTTGNGLVWRGLASDTVTKPSNYANKDIKAYLLLDTVNNVLYNYIASKGGWKFNNSDTVIIQGLTMPFDSITFNTAKDGTVGVGEVEYNDTQGSLIQGLKGGNVTNVIGQQLHQRVSNKTGGTLAKGTAVYLSGSQGNRITVAKALATSDPTSANTFGIVAEEILNNATGYVITEGLITNINTSSLTQDSAVYLSGTTAGALISTKPQAPIHGVYIGVCVKTNAGSGELFIKIRNGQELDELHDVQITSPVNNASLYYKSSEGLWRDTTASLLVSDTATMLTNYLRTGVAASTYQAKLNGTGFVKASGTSITYDNSTYLTTSSAASTYLPLTGGTVSGTINRQEGSNDGSSSTFYYNILNYFAKRDNNKGNQTAQITFTDRPGTATFENNVRTSDIYLMTAKNLSGGQLGQYLDTTLSIVANQDGGRVGISKLNPAYKLDVNGTFNASGNSLIGGTLGVTGNITGSSFIKSGGTSSQFLKADGTTDSNTYLPLTGGTLTGTVNGTNISLNSNLTISDVIVNNPPSIFTSVATGPSTSASVKFGLNVSNTGSANMFMGGTQLGGGNGTNPNIFFTDTRRAYASIGGIYTGAGITSSGHIIFTTTPNDNTTALTERMRISEDGAITMGGTLGITGATTMTGALTVNNSAVFNEGSTDSDFRVESDGNANMVFVDASTDRVGIGTNTPSKTLDVNGEVKIATTTATPTSLLGKDGSNVVGEVTTVAQTGLMTRGSTNVTTGTPSAVFTVTHGLGSNPTAVIVTSAGIAGAQKIIYEVYAKNSTTFSVQAWNYDGTEAANKNVTIYWMAIK